MWFDCHGLQLFHRTREPQKRPCSSGSTAGESTTGFKKKAGGEGEEEWEESKAESKAASARAEFEQRASVQQEALQAHIRAFRGKALAQIS